MITIVYDGRQVEVRDAELASFDGRSEAEIKARLAFFLDVWPRLLDPYHLARLPDGTLVLSPET